MFLFDVVRFLDFWRGCVLVRVNLIWSSIVFIDGSDLFFSFDLCCCRFIDIELLN